VDDLNKERIKFNVEIIKLLTLLFITTGGGGIALIVKGGRSVTELILGVAGMFFAAVVAAMGIFLYKNTLRKLKDYETG
jgi:drug/metabolite transporter (DMT)-like permease